MRKGGNFFTFRDMAVRENNGFVHTVARMIEIVVSIRGRRVEPRRALHRPSRTTQSPMTGKAKTIHRAHHRLGLRKTGSPHPPCRGTSRTRTDAPSNMPDPQAPQDHPHPHVSPNYGVTRQYAEQRTTRRLSPLLDKDGKEIRPRGVRRTPLLLRAKRSTAR